eukprot:2323730-Pyramimonas_sp.AAC.1
MRARSVSMAPQTRVARIAGASRPMPQPAAGPPTLPRRRPTASLPIRPRPRPMCSRAPRHSGTGE